MRFCAEVTRADGPRPQHPDEEIHPNLGTAPKRVIPPAALSPGLQKAAGSLPEIPADVGQCCREIGQAAGRQKLKWYRVPFQLSDF